MNQFSYVAAMQRGSFGNEIPDNPVFCSLTIKGLPIKQPFGFFG